MNKRLLVAVFIALAALIAVPTFFAVRHAFNGHNERMIEIGRQKGQRTHYATVAENARLRREAELKIRLGIEQGLSVSLKKLKEDQAKREADDLVSRKNIEFLIAKDPEFYTNKLCTIPDEMLAERNRIRAND